MDVDVNSGNLFYQTYRDQNPCWPLLSCALVMAVIALAGICFNGTVIYVTIRTKSLQGTANFLLALTSLFEIAHQSGHLAFAGCALCGHYFLPFWMALRFSTLPLLGLSASTLSMLLTGLDRLLIVLCPSPSRPKMLKTWHCLALLTAFCAAFGVGTVFLFYRDGAHISELQVTASVGDILMQDGWATTFYSNSKLFLNTATIVVYVLVGLFIWLRKGPDASTMEQVNRRFYRSLLIIIVANVGGYYAISVFYVFIAPSLRSPVATWFVRLALSIPANLSAASNAPILYLSSEEYRKAILRELEPLFKCFCRTNAVQPQPTFKRNESADQRARTNKLSNRSYQVAS